MHLTYQILLNVLSNAATPLTRAEIWELIPKDQQKNFNQKLDSVSTSMNAMIFKKFWAATADSKFVNGKPCIAYVISDKGLQDYKAWVASNPVEKEELPTIRLPLSVLTDLEPKAIDQAMLAPTLEDVIQCAQELSGIAIQVAAMAKLINDNPVYIKEPTPTPTIKEKAATLSVLRNVADMVKPEYSEKLCYVAGLVEMLTEE